MKRLSGICVYGVRVGTTADISESLYRASAGPP